MEKIAVIGAGGWGTALSIVFSKKTDVILWERFSEYAKILSSTRENLEFLPGIKIPESVVITNSIEDACSNSKTIIMAVPSRYFRNVIIEIKPFYRKQEILIASKGIEPETGMRMSEILYNEIGCHNFAVISGPTIAYEVAVGNPTAAVIAARNINLARKFQEMFSSEKFRLYTSNDVCGVEICGGYKNVLAIGSGIIDTLKLGDNTRAAYLTRGVHEMKNFGITLGAKEKTFWGLAGIGDLITTSISPTSRNHRFGKAIAAGKGNEFLSSTKMIVEGIFASKAIIKMSKENNVEIPIASAIYRIIHEHTSPMDEIRKLMTRQLKDE
ncbi:MAG TPA: NAD(P)H-dependent glycerol-3-phosphate dehydrogenase [Candidatus Ratteibacteria bacterium]|mgnify:CR=1 FL=1|nr:NAD(P)H-dependent glycerol-3-phosphate dehydrogenase [bacterium]HPC29117.1 NAD(P)H-dependent glycerol-3-phosphate dehydrogenase [bacterium]HQL64302.1 NAD(P)H-dependent glycerol-3-phosphate dehydrogenase [bacterium]HRS06119.1 NAD(P)H-dependent glycerol-3-phosphate dehydrogenase [Candidatus Ratteibacteria bacterium]